MLLGLIRLLIIAVISVWSAGAIEYLPNSAEDFKVILLITLLLCGLIIIFVPRLFRRWFLLPIAGFTGIFAFSLFQFFSLVPGNQKDWTATVAVLPSVSRNENLITINNIRNFHYKTEKDFITDYYNKTFDLNQLTSVDFIVSYWEGTDIAHVMTSFGFAEKDFISFSIETRTERNEGYSTFGGFYRNYELIYIAADERDLVGLRTKIRDPQERVYLFRTRMPVENARKLFLQYVNEMEELNQKPRFYNTLTTNCTTQILWNVQTFNHKAKYDWKIFLSGHLPEYLYENGSIDNSMPFESLLELSQINETANENIENKDFSLEIRKGLPRPAYRTD